MSGNRWAFAVLMLISLVPDSSEACLFCHGRGRRGLFDRCGVGASCGAPSGDCCAPMLPPSPCFTPPPQPCLVPQQITTFRDVPQTCYRQEPICVSVPVTTARQVTVDEGCFQQVWVPRLVTRSVPQTVYQQQTAYRTVPVTTMARIPVTETRMVPMMPGCAAPIAPGCSAPCSGGMMIPGDIPPLGPAAPTPYGMPSIPGATSVPPAGNAPTLPPVSFGTPSAMYNPPSGSAPLIPVPTAKDPVETRTSSAEEWSSIERRAAFFQQEFGYRPFGARVQQTGFTSN